MPESAHLKNNKFFVTRLARINAIPDIIARYSILFSLNEHNCDNVTGFCFPAHHFDHSVTLSNLTSTIMNEFHCFFSMCENIFEAISALQLQYKMKTRLQTVMS